MLSPSSNHEPPAASALEPLLVDRGDSCFPTRAITRRMFTKIFLHAPAAAGSFRMTCTVIILASFIVGGITARNQADDFHRQGLHQHRENIAAYYYARATFASLTLAINSRLFAFKCAHGYLSSALSRRGIILVLSTAEY